MGLFEIGLFANGFINIAKSMALAYCSGSMILVGGGETIEALKRTGVCDGEVRHVSTREGTSLKYLAGDEMHRLAVLTDE